MEIQVAMVMLSIGTMGLYSLNVIQTRQTTRLEQMLPPDDGRDAPEIASINRTSAATGAETAWARKLGAYAEISDAGVVPSPAPIAFNSGYQQIVDNSNTSQFFTFGGNGTQTWQQYEGHPNSFGTDVTQIERTNGSGAIAYFVFLNVPEGEYDLYVYVPRKDPTLAGTLSASAPHWIYGYANDDGSIGSGYVYVDQQNLRQDLFQEARWWQRLGSYTVRNGFFYVMLPDYGVTNEWLVADTVMLTSRRSWEVQGSVGETAVGGATVTVELQ